jgi:DNA-binding HxlR family transcriptional regulator
MDKKKDNAARNKRIDELSRKSFELDDICHEIWFTLMAKKKLRFNQLLRALKKLGVNITKPTLKDHLQHLIEQNLIERKEEGFQKVSYSLTEEIHDILHTPQEDIDKWFEALTKPNKLFSIFEEFDPKQYYEKISEKQLEQEIDRDIDQVLRLNLHELKNFVQHDLRLDKDESDADFWKLVGNPMYRMLEKSIAENCRASNRYRKKLFEEINLLIAPMRPDKELSREKEERRKRSSTP